MGLGTLALGIANGPCIKMAHYPENRDSRHRGCLNVILPTQRCVNNLNGLRQQVGKRGDAYGCISRGTHKRRLLSSRL
jgi:hypothetical protein